MGDVVAVVTDLFFASRVVAAAKAAGRQVRFLSSNDAVREVRQETLALVDLDADLDVLAAIRCLSAAGTPVIAFGPHVDVEGRKAARSAGAGRVMAKSKFVSELPKLMASPSSSEVSTQNVRDSSIESGS